MIGVVAALPQEVSTLAGPLPPGGAAPLGGHARLQLSGMGQGNARRAALMLADAGATHLLSWGSAGGISPALPTGALLLPLMVRRADAQGFAITPAWHQQLHAKLAPALPVHTGDLLEVSQMVATTQEKQRLFCASGALAIDMESAAIAQVAAQRGLAFAVLRVVLDTAQRPLPHTALVAVDHSGRLQLGHLLRALLLHPGDLAGLLQLRADLRLTQARLGQVAQLTGLRSPSWTAWPKGVAA